MTMYLPNRDVLPTGGEVAEFIEDPILADDAGADDSTEEHEDVEAKEE